MLFTPSTISEKIKNTQTKAEDLEGISLPSSVEKGDSYGDVSGIYCTGPYGLDPEDLMFFEDAMKAALACKGAGFHGTGVYDGVRAGELDIIKNVCYHSFAEFPESLEYIKKEEL